MHKGKPKKIVDYDFKQSRKDDDNLTLASREWITGDPAADFIGDIRDLVEED